MIRRQRIIVMLLMGVTLSACRSAPTRLFSLQAIAPSAAPSHGPGAPNAYQGPALRVDSVTVPPAFDRLELVTETRPAQLKIEDLDEWSAPLVDEARQTLSADLIARLPAGRVIFPHLMKPEGTLGLSVDVLEFHADDAGASMLASWSIDAASGNHGATGGTATLRIPLSAGTSPAMVTAWDQLLAQLADRIVDSLGR
jgi:uncharacterized lipoprotein YmbA